MLLLSVAGSITGTVAWFTASNVVSASGMYVMAEKEDGIVMANESLTGWSTAVTASHDGKIGENQAGFIPTSTLDGAAWAHASAVQADDEVAVENSYHMLTTSENSNGVYKATINDAAKNIYLLNKFYLKSASTSTITGDLYSYVKAEVTGTSARAELNKALRVLVKYGSDVNIYAPISGGTTSYTVCTAVTEDDTSTPDTNEYAKTMTAIPAANGVFTGATTHKLSSAVTIPANIPAAPDTVNTFEVQVFAYFEGEDAACFSNNIVATLDKLSITVKLGTASNLA
jgi:hypothetical protein